MKSASFGSSTYVTWQGWRSPDLTCPPSDATGKSLVNDVEEIRKAAGVSGAVSPGTGRSKIAGAFLREETP